MNLLEYTNLRDYNNKQKIPEVSIIVPVYNVEKYLQSCIDSILEQTYPNMEIILVDDGSTDQCGSICEENSTLDERIQVIHKENGGLSSARNAGLDIAKGKYVAFVDADDTIHREFIEILLALCEKYECDIAQCDFLTVAEDSLKMPLNPCQSLIFYTGAQALSALCIGKDDVKYSVAWNKIYRRELFQKIRYPKGRIHEDEFTTYKVLWKARKIVVTNQYLYYYLQRTGSIIRSRYSLKRLDVIAAFRERLEFLKKNGLEKEWTATIHKYIGLIERVCASLKMDVEDCEDICNKLLKERNELMEQFPKDSGEVKNVVQKEWIPDGYMYPKDAKLVLYGAGKWGRICYQWICDHHYGEVTGWVDNQWSGITQTEIPITPLDSLLTLSYDYVLITIINEAVQKEIAENLRCWGIPEKKILRIMVT